MESRRAAVVMENAAISASVEKNKDLLWLAMLGVAVFNEIANGFDQRSGKYVKSGD